MQSPKFEIFKTGLNGKVAFELVVRNSRACPELHALIESLGYEPSVGIANRRAIICATPAAIDAARNPIAIFFGRAGEFLS